MSDCRNIYVCICFDFFDFFDSFDCFDSFDSFLVVNTFIFRIGG